MFYEVPDVTVHHDVQITSLDGKKFKDPLDFYEIRNTWPTKLLYPDRLTRKMGKAFLAGNFDEFNHYRDTLERDYFKKFKSATYQFTRSKWNVLDLYRKLKDKMLWEEILYKGSINNALN